MSKAMVRNLCIGAAVLMTLNSCNWLSSVFRPYPEEPMVTPYPAPQPIPDKQPENDEIQPPDNVEPKPKQKDYPTAKKVDGRPFHVLNPYTGNLVDVEGLPSGMLVRDPADPDETHLFRVP